MSGERVFGRPNPFFVSRQLYLDSPFEGAKEHVHGFRQHFFLEMKRNIAEYLLEIMLLKLEHSFIRFVLLLWCGISLMPLRALEISRFLPHALMPGKTNEISFTGDRLETATTLWTSFGSSVSKLTNSAGSEARFAIDVPAQLTGIQILQLIGTNGASSYQLIFVDSLPRQTHSDKHQKFETAQAITPPAAVDCLLKNEAADYYSFEAKQGQMLSIDVMAHRLGSSMDPVVRVLDEQQRELFFCEDDALGERDSRFQFTAPRDGRFYLDVHDVAYQGGTAFDYRLRVGAFPLLSYTYPLGVQRGHKSKLELLGPAVEGIHQISVRTSATNTARIFAGSSNYFAPVLVDDLSELTEAEPNNTTKLASPAFVPAIFNGRFDAPRDRDLFSFEVVKDQKIHFRAETRSAGSPCDVVLKILDPAGKSLAESNPADPGEGAVGYTFVESGRYYLEVTELTEQGNPSLVYRVIAEEGLPLFSLACDNDHLGIPASGTASFKITAIRTGYDGPIELSCDNLDPRFSLENSTIEKGKKETDLKIKAPPGAPGEFTHFKIRGRATAPAGYTAIVSTGPALKKTFPMLLHPPRELDGLFTLSLTPAKTTTTAEK
jgi:hypothetical protein